MSAEHDRLEAYYDDALDDAERAAFEQHLVACTACQARLDQLMALDAMTAEARTAAGAGAPVIPLAPRRNRRMGALVAAGVALAAAAILLLWWRVGDRPHGDPTHVAIALAPERHVESRLSWSPAAAHRPYTTMRGDGDAEPGARAAVATLEARGDTAGVAAAWLLAGSPDRALAALGDARGPDADSDRAAILLALDRPEDALAAADAALAAAPDHAAARWNRALALRQLNQPAAAAAEWRRIAARGEPGWADEATARAAQLERDLVPPP